MAEEKFEELDLKIKESVLSSDINELGTLTNQSALKQEDIEGKSRRVLSKLVRKTIDPNVDKYESFQKKVEYLEKLQETLNVEPPPLEEPEENVNDTTGSVVESQSTTSKETVSKVDKVASDNQSSPFAVYGREFEDCWHSRASQRARKTDCLLSA